MALTPKQERFCEEYIIDLNGAAAARRAGYSEKTAHEQAAQLLAKLSIQQKISELRKGISDNNGNLIQKVIDELVKVGFSNIQDYIGAGNSVVDMSSIDEGKAAAVSSVKKSLTVFEGGTKETVEFKLWDKLSALEKLGKHLGIFEADNKQKAAIIKVTDLDE